MTTIAEFINETNEKLKSRPVDPYNPIDWNFELKQAGFLSVEISNLQQWNKIHAWCCDHIGEDHYVWTGSTFWFENEQDVLLFSLCWS